MGTPKNPLIPDGKAVQILEISRSTDNSGLVFRPDALKEVLDEIPKGHQMVVFSIVGAARQGKSCILNYFLRYLHNIEYLGDKDEDAVGQNVRGLGDPKDTTPLRGFEFENGVDRKTVGIWMWSKPFLLNLDDDNESKVAILLMDTQGLFDEYTTDQEQSAIFGFSLFASSCLVYNLVFNVDESHLTILDTYLQFGTLAMDKTGGIKRNKPKSKPYQRLLFLIRDWNNQDEHGYGFDGGKAFISKKLEVKDHHPEELKRVRQTLKTCFESVECYLMPAPHEKMKSKDFRGAMCDLDDTFRDQLIDLVENTFDAELKAKKIAGRELSGPHEYINFLQQYVDLFNQGGIPSPVSLMDATAQAVCGNLVQEIGVTYKNIMKELMSGPPFPAEDDIKAKHDKMATECRGKYDEAKKIGSEDIHRQYAKKLEEEFDTVLKYLRMEMDQDFVSFIDQRIERLCSDFESNLAPHSASFISFNKLQEFMTEEEEKAFQMFFEGKTKDSQLQPHSHKLLSQLKEKKKTIQAKYKSHFAPKDNEAQNSVQELLSEFEERVGNALKNGFLAPASLQKVEDDNRRIAEKQFQTSLQKLTSDPELHKAYSAYLSGLMDQKHMDFKAQNEKLKEALEADLDKFIMGHVASYKRSMGKYVDNNPFINLQTLQLESGKVEREKSMELLRFMSENSFDASLIAKSQTTLGNRVKEAWEQVLGSFQVKQEEQMAQAGNIHEELISKFVRNLKHFAFNEEEGMPTQKDCKSHAIDLENRSLTEFTVPEAMGKREEQVKRMEFQRRLKEEADKVLTELKDTIGELTLEGGQYCLDTIAEIKSKLEIAFPSLSSLQELEKLLASELNSAQSNLEKIVSKCPEENSKVMRKTLQDHYQIMSQQLTSSFSANLTGRLRQCKAKISDIVAEYQASIDAKCSEAKAKDVLHAWHQFYEEKAMTDFKDFLKAQCVGIKKNELLEELKDAIHKIYDLKRNLVGSEEAEKITKDFEKDVIRQYSIVISNKMQDPSLTTEGLDKFHQLTSDDLVMEKVTLAKSLHFTEEQVAALKSALVKALGEELTNVKNRKTKESQRKFDQTLQKVENTYMDSMKRLRRAGETMSKADSLSRIAALHDFQTEFGGTGETFKDQFEAALKVWKETFEKGGGTLSRNPSSAARIGGGGGDGGIHKPLGGRVEELVQRYGERPPVAPKPMARSSKPQRSQPFLDPEERGGNVVQVAKQMYFEQMSDIQSGGFVRPDALHEQHVDLVGEIVKKLRLSVGEEEEEVRETLNNLYEKEKDDNLKKMADHPAIGIDLGTTYSCVSVYHNGKAIVIPNELNEKTTPSYVALFDGQQVVGKKAKSEAYLRPSNTIFDAKRLIGRPFDDPVVQKDIKLWPFKVVNDGGNPSIEVDNGGKVERLVPEQISAKVLKKMKTIAEAFLHKTVKSAVITIPAYFNDSQREATKHAGAIAGLKVLGLLNEPTSAAIAYNLQYTDENSRNVLIFDMGGGTFDVSVLTMTGSKIVTKAVDGDTHLGGEDFDSLLVEHCIKRFSEQHPGINLTAAKDDARLKFDSNRRLRRIRGACEQQKIYLSACEVACVTVDAIYETHDLNVNIKRTEFEDMIKPLVDRAMATVGRALQNAGLRANELHDVALVGGSSQIPLIKRSLTDMFGVISKKYINPDEVVAQGAAIHAAILSGQESATLSHLEFTDVAPFSIGVELFDGSFDKLVKNNSALPISISEEYETSMDNQTSVSIDIYEGEDPIARNNHLLGKFELTGIPPSTAGSQKIQVTMTMAEDAILHVSAECRGHDGNRQVMKVIERKSRLTNEQVIMLSHKG